MTADELKAIAAFVDGLDRLEIAHGVCLDLAGSYDDRFIRLSIDPSVRLRRFPHEVEIHPNGHDLTLVRSDVDVSAGSVERREAQPGQDASAGYQRVSIVFGGGGGGYRGQGGDVSSGTGGGVERHPSSPTPPAAGSGNVPLVLLVPGAGGGIGGEGTGGREPRPIDERTWSGATSIVDDVPEGAEARGGGVTVSNRPICETEGCEREATTDGPNGTFLCDDCAGEP